MPKSGSSSHLHNAGAQYVTCHIAYFRRIMCKKVIRHKNYKNWSTEELDQANICFTTRPLTPITESNYKEKIKKNEVSGNKKLAFCVAKGEADDSEPWATQYVADISTGAITCTTRAKDVATILWHQHSNTYNSKRAVQVPFEEASHVVKRKTKSTETENQYGKRRVPEMPSEEEINNTNADDTGAIMSINKSLKYTMGLGKKALKEKIEENKEFVELLGHYIVSFDDNCSVPSFKHVILSFVTYHTFIL
ncbi:unnamed protein product [Mytilus coruscus]|uniref:Uncharacterized protein n=1 Tax=Mytilus coruscus TaxID=42192 RepID=A0A6J8A4P8_MYTCO|nr:unnamed protein product [Mytilus coruscus]